MDDLQYYDKEKEREMDTIIGVLNLIINGWPSILEGYSRSQSDTMVKVLNLIINGWPSILLNYST